MNVFYTYIVFRLTGIPCYVGKGKGERVAHNIAKSHNPHLARIIAKSGGALPFVKVRENISEADAFETERALIAVIGRGKNGPLVNLTDGGDGVSGHIQTPTQLAKLSAARKGKSPSKEAREKIRLKLAGVTKTPEHCAAVSAAKRGKSSGPMPELQKRAIAAANLGQKRSADQIANMIKANAERSEEKRRLKSERITAALTGKKLSTEHRASISAVQKGRKRSAEFRAKVSAGMKLSIAARKAQSIAMA